MTPIILASSSPYRRQLLQRLALPFQWASPAINETPLPDEDAPQLVARLSEQKARALAAQYPSHLIIASDQAATLNNSILGKPGNHSNAVSQLSRCSGSTIRFYTGLVLLNTDTGKLQQAVEPFAVRFRKLEQGSIERYLLAEKPYDCAGSFKAEGLGIALFQQLSGNDPNSLIGLPLIRLVEFLANENIDVLQPRHL